VPAIGLVLGGGGATGLAFHAGALAALEEVVGFDARSARIIVGTSAGASTGAFIRAGFGGEDLVRRALGDSPAAEVADALERYGPPIDVSALPKPRMVSRQGPAAPRRLLQAVRRPRGQRVGTLFSALVSEGKVSPTIVSEPMDRMFADGWPNEPLWVCVVRLDEGARVVWHAGSTEGEVDVTIGTAVAASCAVPGWYKPVVVNGARFVDGGVWSPTNADVLADEDLDAVIVSSPMSGVPAAARSRTDAGSRLFMRRYVMREIAGLRRRGVPTLILEPSAGDLAKMGGNALDPARRAPVTRQVRESMLERLRSGDLAPRLEELGLG
jgi:NTE family protein